MSERPEPRNLQRPSPFGRPLNEAEAATVMCNLHLDWSRETLAEAAAVNDARMRRNHDQMSMLINGMLAAGICLAAGALGLLGAVLMALLTGLLP
ncbi:MAG: hypothetical protein ACK46Q_13990 [Hyphomonas sp.]